MALPRFVRYYGVDAPLPEQVPLRAGPLSLIYEAGDLRYIRLGDHEILRRIYIAVRDQDWGTAPAELHNVQMQVEDDRFRVEYDVVNRLQAIDFAWHGVITGDPDGTIRFSMDGTARSTFLRNRLGFCVLHPDDCAGLPARITHVDGSQETAAFPVQIAPQLVVDGEIKPVAPFQEMRALAHEVRPGLWAEVQFEGEIFETEDQRNWTDASYKTYGTPLRLPFPVEVPEGARIRQAITLRLEGSLPEMPPQAAQAALPTLTVDEAGARPLPRLGLGLASHGAPLTPTEVERLRALHLAHLRVDLHLGAVGTLETLRRAAEAARALGVQLEVALFLPDDPGPALLNLAQVVGVAQPPVWTLLVFRRRSRSTQPQDVDLVRRVLGPLLPQALFGGGTDNFFTDLNRLRPPVRDLDLVCYSLNPQVHAFDNASLVETLQTQATTVASARALIGDRPLAVTPVTLRMRHNPNASGPEDTQEAGAQETRPPQVDVRQMSLLGAGWTVGSLKYLGTSDTQSLTYYETTGWRGVMETETGSSLPDQFPSRPGTVFPLYHVFADAGEFATGRIAPLTTSHPLRVDGFSLVQGECRSTVVANLSPNPQTVEVRGLPAQVRIRLLDADNVELAMAEPERYRAQPGAEQATTNGVLRLSLSPYAIARIDGR